MQDAIPPKEGGMLAVLGSEIKIIEDMIKNSHEWITLVPNKKEETLKELTPVNVSGKLQIYTGRVRKMLMGDEYLNAFTLGDQLLWGAAEPLRRILRKLLFQFSFLEKGR